MFTLGKYLYSILTCIYIFRGKGDYYRLGHGDDSHQRTPCRVLGLLANEKVIDIGCGSLHCIVCTESGKVFAWGDNDEGQIGNDTTQAVSVPKVSLSIKFSRNIELSIILLSFL